MRTKLRVLTLTAAAAAATAVVVAPATPALAGGSCPIPSGQISCTVAGVLAGGDRSVTVTARPGTGTVTCRVHDQNNGNEVGRVTAVFWRDLASKRKTITGLYGMYMAVCIQESGSGGGGALA